MDPACSIHLYTHHSIAESLLEAASALSLEQLGSVAAKQPCRLCISDSHRDEQHASAPFSAQVVSPVQPCQQGARPKRPIAGDPPRGTTSRAFVCAPRSGPLGSTALWSELFKQQPTYELRASQASTLGASYSAQRASQASDGPPTSSARGRTSALVYESALAQRCRLSQDGRTTSGGCIQGLDN